MEKVLITITQFKYRSSEGSAELDTLEGKERNSGGGGSTSFLLIRTTM
jgi:hypothetical protein